MNKNKFTNTNMIWIESSVYPEHTEWNPEDTEKYNSWCKQNNVSASYTMEKKYEDDNATKMMNELNIDDKWITTYIRSMNKK